MPSKGDDRGDLLRKSMLSEVCTSRKDTEWKGKKIDE